ncbi:MAG: hypothetical protein FWG80_02795 [Alphaproteobacteria bacterium]|nr:hypothetical protein [Alphaproteobacteria bacterium]
MRKISTLCFVLCAMFAQEAYSAAAARRANVLNVSSSVRGRVAPTTNLYSTECWESYFGCMDQFCVSDNAQGGRCICSNKNADFEKQLAEVTKQMDEAERIRTIEVEKVEAGARADIIFGGGREYDSEGNVASGPTMSAKERAQARRDRINQMFGSDQFDEDFEEIEAKISDHKGDALYAAARNLCEKQMPESCQKEMSMIGPLYPMEIENDCKAFDLAIKNMQREAKDEIADANKELRDARLASFNEANKFNRGQCLIEFKKCMVRSEVCGSDWGRCASSVASENMQNNRAVSTANTKVSTVDKFELTTSTLEMLESKRNMCEEILDQCMAVRDNIWPDFLRDIAPELKVAELNLESNMRQSCLGDIATCIQKACKDDIAGKGVDTMDACLSRPDMARSFCKVQIDPCERMDPSVWEYVVARLAAMRVDACTEEVKSCLTADDRCGKDYTQCIGLDTETIVRMCPHDKLVACQKVHGNQKITGEAVYDELARIVQGIFLNIDNSFLAECQKAVDEAMIKVCGDTENCDRLLVEGGGKHLKYEICEFKEGKADTLVPTSACFPSADAIPMARLLDQNAPGLAGFIKNTLFWGNISYDFENNKFTTWEEYKTHAGISTDDETYDLAREGFELEVRQMANSVENAIKTIETDPKVQFCMTGREVQGMGSTTTLSNARNQSDARFPNITDQMRAIIAISALSSAMQNYSQAYQKYLNQISEDRVSIAQTMDRAAAAETAARTCEELPGKSTLPKSPAPPPLGKSFFALSAGVLAAPFTGGLSLVVGGIAATKAADSGRNVIENHNYKETVTSTFSAETGICTLRRTTQNCKKPKRRSCKQWADQETTTEEIVLYNTGRL